MIEWRFTADGFNVIDYLASVKQDAGERELPAGGEDEKAEISGATTDGTRFGECGGRR